MPFLSPQGRYAIATKAEKKAMARRITTLIHQEDKDDDGLFQDTRDSFLDGNNLEPDN